MVKFEGRFVADLQKRATKQLFKKLLIIYAVLAIILIALGIYTLKNSLDLGIFLIFIGVIIVPIGLIIRNSSSNNVARSMALFSEYTIFKFAMDENNYYYEMIKDPDYRSAVEASYNSIFKVVKTKCEYFVFLSSNQMQVIPFDYIYEGTLEEADIYFKNNLGDKFINNFK